jgi:phasin family protein
LKRFPMFNSPEQLISMQKAALDAFQAVTLKSVEGFEKLAELNIQVVKASLTESGEQAKALLGAKDAKAVTEFFSVGAQPAAEKSAAYAKHVYEIAADTSAEIAKIIEKQFSEGNKQLSAAIEAASKNAPAGSEGIVTFVKSAVSSANTAFDQVNKATKQVVDMAEANFAAVSKKAPAHKAA